MPSFLVSTLIFLATVIVIVTNGEETPCDFCPNGIENPNAFVNGSDGTICSEVPGLLVGDPERCDFASGYESLCCPGGDNCILCPDGVKYPDVEVEREGNTTTCAALATSAESLKGDNCDNVVALGFSTCCPASIVSSTIAFVATAWIGLIMVAY